MKKFICRKVADIQHAAFPENKLFRRNFFQELGTLLWNKYLKEHVWRAGSVSRDLIQSQKTDERWKTKKVIEAKTIKVLKECL